MAAVISRTELADWVGQETGNSEWIRIDQARINGFADVTEDWQAIHVDEAAAKQSVFGGTIAHGFLTLSMLSKFAYEAGLGVEGAVAGVNYGFDKVRMISPVRAGARIRGRLKLMSVEEKSAIRIALRYAATVEIEGEDKPALVAEWLVMQELAESASAS